MKHIKTPVALMPYPQFPIKVASRAGYPAAPRFASTVFPSRKLVLNIQTPAEEILESAPANKGRAY